MPAKPWFDRKFLRFLQELEANNDRAWFEKNKPRYMEEVRNPILAFVSAFGPRLQKISKHIVADPRPSGGSMFRIYRDTRFSKDKTPYKTYASAQFRHEAYKDAHAPCFYLHVQPGGSFAGAGLWHPDADSTRKIRQSIVDHAREWKRLTNAPAWRALCALQGDSLQRPPRGFDPEHALIEDLKRKDFIAVTSFKDAEVCSANFMDTFVTFCRANNKWMQFLTRAVGVAW